MAAQKQEQTLPSDAIHEGRAIDCGVDEEGETFFSRLEKLVLFTLFLVYYWQSFSCCFILFIFNPWSTFSVPRTHPLRVTLAKRFASNSLFPPFLSCYCYCLFHSVDISQIVEVSSVPNVQQRDFLLLWAWSSAAAPVWGRRNSEGARECDTHVG
jgi:hypothetical protein